MIDCRVWLRGRLTSGRCAPPLRALLDDSARATAAFWSTHSGAELDLRATVGGRTLGFEIKRTEQAKATRSMHSAPSTIFQEMLQ